MLRSRLAVRFVEAIGAEICLCLDMALRRKSGIVNVYRRWLADIGSGDGYIGLLKIVLLLGPSTILFA